MSLTGTEHLGGPTDQAHPDSTVEASKFLDKLQLINPHVSQNKAPMSDALPEEFKSHMAGSSADQSLLSYPKTPGPGANKGVGESMGEGLPQHLVKSFSDLSSWFLANREANRVPQLSMGTMTLIATEELDKLRDGSKGKRIVQDEAASMESKDPAAGGPQSGKNYIEGFEAGPIPAPSNLSSGSGETQRPGLMTPTHSEGYSMSADQTSKPGKSASGHAESPTGQSKDSEDFLSRLSGLIASKIGSIRGDKELTRFLYENGNTRPQLTEIIFGDCSAVFGRPYKPETQGMNEKNEAKPSNDLHGPRPALDPSNTGTIKGDKELCAFLYENGNTRHQLTKVTFGDCSAEFGREYEPETAGSGEKNERAGSGSQR